MPCSDTHRNSYARGQTREGRGKGGRTRHSRSGSGWFSFQVFSLMELTLSGLTELINSDKSGEGVYFLKSLRPQVEPPVSVHTGWGRGRVL